MDRPYATLDGVRTYLGSIEGLHALREARRAANARFERMPAFCALGRWLLTEDGRFGELIGASLEAGRSAPDVVPLALFEREAASMHGPDWRLAYRTPAPLAPHDAACEGCGRGWTLQDCHDVEDDFVTDAVLPYHPECLRTRRRGDLLWWAEDVLARAGFTDIEPALQQGPNADPAFPWFRIETPHGSIRFGRLAPGFGIEWAETGRDLSGSFCRRDGMVGGFAAWTEPPVDNGPFHVRPKDEAYLVLYLDRLRGALGL